MGKFKRGKSGGTCRCGMCGEKDAGKKNVNSYWRAGLRKDESRVGNQMQKRRHRKVRRLREKRMWKNGEE